MEGCVLLPFVDAQTERLCSSRKLERCIATLCGGLIGGLTSYSADIVKMIDSQPELAPLIRRVRGGYLKIQGTWMPYEASSHLLPPSD